MNDNNRQPTNAARSAVHSSLAHDSAVKHVTGAADLRIDQATRHGVDFHRILPQQPAGHVEIVNHHVAKQAAGGGDVALRHLGGGV